MHEQQEKEVQQRNRKLFSKTRHPDLEEYNEMDPQQSASVTDGSSRRGSGEPGDTSPDASNKGCKQERGGKPNGSSRRTSREATCRTESQEERSRGVERAEFKKDMFTKLQDPPNSNPRLSSPGHIIMKLSKITGEKRLKSSHRLTCAPGNPHRLSADLSTEAMEARGNGGRRPAG